MRHLRSSAWIFGLLLFLSLSAHAAPRTLHVSLYPFIPEAEAAALTLTRDFERTHPDIRLDITFNPHYYNADPADKGVLYEDADVHEIDSIFFRDFVDAGKLLPLPTEFVASTGQIVPVAAASGMFQGVAFAIPHWLCSDFLMYRADQTTLAHARTLTDVEHVLLPSHGLILDIAGDGALGELYLASASSVAAAPDKAFLGRARRILAMEPPGFGRSAAYDARPGFYARQFARRAGAAYVGYSEMLHDALQETVTSCRVEDKCLTASDIKITAWPFTDQNPHTPVWVDMFGIDARVHGAALADAEMFIRFATAHETYRRLLIPQAGEPPRYLLPARDDVYHDSDILTAAPLYPAFRHIIDGGVVNSAPHLNALMHQAAAAIERALPPTH
jgi:thiamine pyridinylase